MSKALLLFIIAMLLLSAGAQAAESESSALTLESFLKAVKEQSPDLTVTNAEAKAARARAAGIRLMPPMFGLMEMREGNSRSTGFEVSQAIPFPTKIVKERRVRLLDAQAEEEESKGETAAILADARLAYVSYWSAAERLEVLKERHAWLRKHSRLARSTARYDTESQIHFLEIESQEDETENEVLAAEAELVERRNELRVFAPSLKLENSKPEEPEVVEVDQQVQTTPLIRALEKEAESKAAMESLGKSSYLPDFFVRYRSFEESAMIPQSQELMVGITLPFLYFWQPSAEVKQASAERQRAEAELLKARTRFDAQLESLIQKEKSIRSQLTNLKNKLLPRSEKRSRLVRNVSQRTQEGLDQHNNVMLAHLNLRLNAIELRLEHERTVKEILSLTGQNAKAGAK